MAQFISFFSLFLFSYFFIVIFLNFVSFFKEYLYKYVHFINYNNKFLKNILLSNKTKLYKLYFCCNTPNHYLKFLFKLLNNCFFINKKTTLLFLQNKRIKHNVKNSYFYKHSINFNSTFSKESLFLNFLIGFKSAWLLLRNWIFSLLLGTFSLFYLSFLKLSFFNILIFKIIICFGIFYWLFSGFTFFLKKYQYRYFTSSIQRFWKRCYSIFWLIEFFLFFIYFYLTFMASQEPFLMYDNAQIFKTHLFSWKFFLLKIMPSIILIMFTYFLIISTKWTTISKLDNLLMLITFLLFYLFWLEFYQFFHILSYYGNYVWKISDDLTYWYLEAEFKRTRINNHFISICLMAKFWHIVFTLVFWLFFILKNLETSKLRYPLLVANFQNFIFIYVLTWLYMFPWFKYTFLKLFNNPYHWFYVNNKKQIVYFLFNDFFFFIKQLCSDIFFLPVSIFNKLLFINKTYSSNFYYYHSSSHNLSFSQYKQKFIRDCFIKNLNK